MRASSLYRLALLASLAWASFGSVAEAQQSKLGLSPEKQKEYDELMQSARRSQTMGAIAIQIGAGLMGVALFWGAYSTYKKGFKFGGAKRIEGRPAAIMAVVLVVLGIGVIVGGILFGASAYPK
jgi:hypothetical protein